MQIETLATASLVPYARNSHTHSEAQVAQIAASIREFGFTNPVLIDGQGGLIAGHGRVMAATVLGMAEVPCIRLGHLTDTQKRAYIIADNRIPMNAGWDEEMLKLELDVLKSLDCDLAITGFSENELDLLGSGKQKPLTTEKLRQAEKSTDQAPSDEAKFKAEMSRTDTAGTAPIVPQYAEHHQAFIIVCENSIDEAWIRNRLGLEAPQQSYKDSKIRQTNVLTIGQLKALMK